MKTGFRALTLWLVLGGLSYLLVQAAGEKVMHPLAALAVFVLPLLAVWLTARAVAGLPQSRWGRLGFWVVTVAGWVTLLVLLQGRVEAHDGERRIIFSTLLLAGVLILRQAIRTRSLPSRRVFGEVLAAVAVLAVGGAVFAWGYEARTRSLVAQAEARWTEIGLPMAEFERTLTPSRENAGSEVVRQVLREKVNALFYKAGTRAAEAEPALSSTPSGGPLLKAAVEILSVESPPADDLVFPATSVAVFEPVTATLDADYRRILEAEPASWASDPHDGYALSVPNFLGVRQFSQIVAADSLRRLAVGDQDGAARALAAGLRLRPGLLENPSLISLMIAVAVDASLCAKQVRLPASEEGLAVVAPDVVRLRAEFLRRLRMEAWVALQEAGKTVHGDEPFFARGVGGMLPRWAARIAEDRAYRRIFAIGALNGAEHAAIQQSPETLSLPDFGESRHEAIECARPSLVSMNVARAAKRINAMLLLREQVELIRDARVRLAAGRPVESHDSVVLPGLRWELRADEEKGTVATRLVNPPEWIVTNEVTGNNGFWLLPIDGSVSWQFHRITRTADRN